MSLHTFINNSPPNISRVFYGNATPSAPDGNTYFIGDLIVYMPIPISSAATPGSPYGWWCTLGGAGGTATWLPIGQSLPYLATENGANNAVATSAGSGPALVTGLVVTVQLAHTLQAGANTFAYNGGSAIAIKSSLNPANNIATGYAATGVITLQYNGTVWLDLKQ